METCYNLGLLPINQSIHASIHPSIHQPASNLTICFCLALKDSWQSLLRIVEWYGDHQDEMIPVAGPGNWNDPDQVRISLKKEVYEVVGRPEQCQS